MSHAASSRGTEQPVAIPLVGAAHAGLVLEGLFAPSNEDRAVTVMAPPHPLYGGNMENPVVSETADACRRVGLGSLRFNWRGVGASAGTPTGEPEVGVSDYAAALAFAEAKSGGAIVACGYSYGAASGVSAARENPCVKALLLVAPPVLMLNVDALKSFPGRILLVAGDRDEYAPRRELEALATELNAAEFVLLEGTDHYFTRGLEELGRAAERFFRQIASVR